MSSDTQEQLFEVFMEAAGSQAQTLEPTASASGALADSMQGIAGQVSGYSDNYAPPASSGATQGGGSNPLSIAETVFESGLGVIPLVTGLLGLFGGGSSDAPAPLVKYAMPGKTYFEGADTGSGIGGADYDQMGNPRAYGADPAPDATASASPPAGQQITVNVQAMDSQSFLDHSSDIAQAVRAAILNMSSINDVISDL